MNSEIKDWLDKNKEVKKKLPSFINYVENLLKLYRYNLNYELLVYDEHDMVLFVNIYLFYHDLDYFIYQSLQDKLINKLISYDYDIYSKLNVSIEVITK